MEKAHNQKSDAGQSITAHKVLQTAGSESAFSLSPPGDDLGHSAIHQVDLGKTVVPGVISPPEMGAGHVPAHILSVPDVPAFPDTPVMGKIRSVWNDSYNNAHTPPFRNRSRGVREYLGELYKKKEISFERLPDIEGKTVVDFMAERICGQEDGNSVIEMSLLDVGCGEGRSLREIAERIRKKSRNYGVGDSDLSLTTTGFDARITPEAVSNLDECVSGNILSLGSALSGRSFDAIVSSVVLDQLPEPILPIVYQSGLLKPGGVMFNSTIPVSRINPRTGGLHDDGFAVHAADGSVVPLGEVMRTIASLNEGNFSLTYTDATEDHKVLSENMTVPMRKMFDSGKVTVMKTNRDALRLDCSCLWYNPAAVAAYDNFFAFCPSRH